MTEESQQQLLAPIPAKWRIQQSGEYGATCVAYIDAREVMDRLDEVFGMGCWQRDHKEVKGVMYAGIGVYIPSAQDDKWVWKWDCGTESKTEEEKGESSDSFKRAAVNWGIGRFLYDLPIQKLKTKMFDKNQKYYPIDNLGNMIWNGEELTSYLNNLLKLPNGFEDPKEEDIRL